MMDAYVGLTKKAHSRHEPYTGILDRCFLRREVDKDESWKRMCADVWKVLKWTLAHRRFTARFNIYSYIDLTARFMNGDTLMRLRIHRSIGRYAQMDIVR